ncbi:MAG TPA: chlorite dismutase family protein [Acidimicrobiales bacterium]|jgi:chlorite dismutase|nr:chlorite dismutase family protein [Acidimicrobiales bacterium]MDP7117904.1 chlorite dismutase family protein [Acidimicrobiales bacterium]MDP7410606.1 chlorite dismutase family protein [Acidimicrobiales bacterium]MEE1521252.1 chlorite dismutase family protein [Acidimicrobiales bacterium]MEE1570759.1 chlorite dismutase family protein [Acidimicrobiales bacterium]|tara:strand:+ start:1721 stop:2419 length:699 start_codon:yes stop_codon:yes gene_type:complete
MTEPASPSEGLCVLHLFLRVRRSLIGPSVDVRAVKAAVRAATDAGDQVVPVAILGHKADMALMALGDDLWRLRDLQTAVVAAGLEVVESYLSMTEVSEYAAGVPDEMKQARLYPQLPPAGKPAWCFYPMSRSRVVGANWFTLPFEERMELMREHGASGRTFAGRILQVVTGSTGVDDYEWGVTLFGERPDDLKEVVYTMRYDQASAVYADFGPFYTGMVDDIDVVLRRVGCR